MLGQQVIYSPFLPTQQFEWKYQSLFFLKLFRMLSPKKNIKKKLNFLVERYYINPST
jgi:hypothetical protein